MSLPNKKLFYSIVAPLAPALVPILLASLWTSASLIAENSSSDNDAQVKQQENLLVQAKTTQPARDALTSPRIDASSAEKNTTMATVSAVPRATPSQNVTINLINRLVQRGVLTQSDADELIKQAENDAATARATAAKEQTRVVHEDDLSPPPSPFAEPSPLPDTMSSNVAMEPPPPAENKSSDNDDAVNVSYVPDVVKEQLREEIKEEVMEQAREENWANPRMFPTWVLAFKPFADIRVRYEGDFYPSGNDNTGAFPNFNTINTGSPFDASKTSPVRPPELDVDQDRERPRIRVRFGALMDLDEGFTIGVRIATGETDTPVSPNQSLGVANNVQGSDFSKYAIWLDRAFIRYELGGKPSEDFIAQVGRFDNPFFTNSGIMWYDDLAFDGLALSGKYKVAEGITPFATAGIFPVFDTDYNFSTTRPDKFPSEDKWLYGGQAGVSLRFNDDFSAKIAGAFFDFYNIEGKLSDPFVPLTSSDQGDTDDSRPAFAQNGNTYFPIRHILKTADNDFGTIDQFQYYGLATPFRVANFSGNLDYAHFDPVHLTLFGEWIDNVAFDWNDINAIAVNNRVINNPNPKPTNIGHFAGGNTGWIVGLKAGHATLEKRWDWNVGVNYRYVESDATVDGFVDSDFAGNLAGTNLKGYTIFGALALTKNTSFFVRWMSADSIGGPPVRNDILQFDFNARF